MTKEKQKTSMVRVVRSPVFVTNQFMTGSGYEVQLASCDGSVTANILVAETRQKVTLRGDSPTEDGLFVVRLEVNSAPTPAVWTLMDSLSWISGRLNEWMRNNSREKREHRDAVQCLIDELEG